MKKGKARVIFPNPRAIEPEVVTALAHELREVPGVKCAHARHDGIYMRLNVAVSGLRKEITRVVKRFRGRPSATVHHHSPTFTNRPVAVLATGRRKPHHYQPVQT